MLKEEAKQALDCINTGQWLQLEGSVGRWANSFIESKIIVKDVETTNELGPLRFTDGYGRKQTQYRFKIDEDRLREAEDDWLLEAVTRSKCIVGPGRRKTPETVAFNKIIGGNLDYVRKINKVTLVGLARQSHVTFQQIQKYISGKNAPHARTLKRFAVFFKVTMDDLCDPDFIYKRHSLVPMTEDEEYRNAGITKEEAKKNDSKNES